MTKEELKKVKEWWGMVDTILSNPIDVANKALTDVPDLIAALEEAQEALRSYSECFDGCTCGDGWSHETAIKALQ